MIVSGPTNSSGTVPAARSVNPRNLPIMKVALGVAGGLSLARGGNIFHAPHQSVRFQEMVTGT